MAQVVVLDAGALIALYSSKDQHHDWAVQMFVDSCEFELEMPALTFAETLVHPQRSGKAKKFLNSISGLGVSIKDVLASSAIELAELRAKTALKMPDVVVLHQALLSGGRIATTDRTLAEVAKALKVFVYCPA